MTPSTFYCDRQRVTEAIQGRRVAIVGSGPGVVDNAAGFVDSHDVVVRVNNWKLEPVARNAGRRVDVWYSFFGSSIRVPKDYAIAAGVALCVCKCPDTLFMRSAWHIKNRKMRGVDFRYIYKDRADWWFCRTYVPTLDEFTAKFDLLGGHVPTTGFAAILDVIDCAPSSIYLTGFDFFSSGVHNVNERWKRGDPRDPIGHVPLVEAAWLRDNLERLNITTDRRLQLMLAALRRKA